MIKRTRKGKSSYLGSQQLFTDTLVAFEQGRERNSVLPAVHNEHRHGGFFICVHGDIENQ